MDAAKDISSGFTKSHSTFHAALRMRQRGFTPEQVDLVLQYGREVHQCGIVYLVIGRKEVQQFSGEDIDLSCCEGIHVLVSSDGWGVTTYRNRELLRSRDGKRR